MAEPDDPFSEDDEQRIGSDIGQDIGEKITREFSEWLNSTTQSMNQIAAVEGDTINALKSIIKLLEDTATDLRAAIENYE